MFQSDHPRNDPSHQTGMWKLTGTLRGIGDVFDEGRRIGAVSYGLEIYHEYVPTSQGIVGSLQRIEGKAKPLEGLDIALLAEHGTPLTLHLDDGRHLDFFFQADGAIVQRQKGLYRSSST